LNYETVGRSNAVGKSFGSIYIALEDSASKSTHNSRFQPMFSCHGTETMVF
jgi:hypothetical protein